MLSNISPQKANFIAIFLILAVIAGYYTAIYIQILIAEIPFILERPLSVFFGYSLLLIYSLAFGTSAYVIFYKFIKNKS